MPASSCSSRRRRRSGCSAPYAFDHTRLEARLGYVYDQAAPIGEIILGAPSQKAIEARFHGRASHAGMYPEEGRSAILAAARAIADMRLGRIDHQSSANVGVITGGTARNIVPEWCSFDAEARSRDPKTLAILVQEMLDAIGFAASTSDCTAETEIEDSYRGYTFARTSRRCASPRRGCVAPATSRRRRSPGARADANVFNERGPPVRQPRERDGRYPHGRRADRRRGSRGDGRGDARDRRGGPGGVTWR